MLKRNLIIIAIISLAIVFTGNTFGQNSKRKRTTKKAKIATATTSTPPANARTTNPNPNQPGFVLQGNQGTDAERAGSGNATGRKGTRKAIEFESTTRPHNDGIVSNLMKGHEGQQERKAVSGNATGIQATSPNMTQPTNTDLVNNENIPTVNKSAREAGSGNAIGISGGPVNPCITTTPTSCGVPVVTPKPKKSTKRKKP